ncbi:hypothetical protein PSN45_004079 [Yamadazyma tenuis]|uniref:DNA/RNA-binding protein Alba-like domain-containing protein n=1 Tax=Candida tenuis (strain ATCC 10573 / BCRC 21748 / CBS 615 / JCM 9827 / NBRC 10315 / NRRL Y-1498 / VKM Y-70) TaxID=590646 RepID=G3B4Q6_CANTC|nr:uncharacterized protein CANTEDRAFT_113875 [Yamadazyma tenuis ATCC 10573]EGV63846.1 hypothetical protein CANTEDRAFT_113875 [Yamadazyma tenuis ATCC 10573]WEJ96540.1 hypothetical protein PSN45_004079 [Yamadazyma tenuis]
MVLTGKVAPEEEEAKVIILDEKARFENQVIKTGQELSQMVERLNGVPVTSSSVTIDKHDSINTRVEEIINKIQVCEVILLTAQSKNINKLITIVEIAKSKGKSIRQYNKLYQLDSVNNPNYKPSHKISTQKQTDLEPKVYLLPILFIYLVPKDIKVELDWTSQ